MGESTLAAASSCRSGLGVMIIMLARSGCLATRASCLIPQPAGLTNGGPAATYFGVNIVDLEIRPDKRVKQGKSRLKQQYLRKFPPIRKEGDTYKIDGISDKQYPTPIKWSEPVQIDKTARHEDGSGDMGSMLDLVGGSIDMTSPRIELEGSPLMEGAPPEVKSILSLEFANHYNLTSKVKQDLTRKVQDHKLDVDSLSVCIASMTVSIRNDQEQLEAEMQRRGCRDRQRVVSLRGRIRKRLVLLKWLRARDYKKFEWLLETLNIVYKPRPFEHEEIQRRVHQARLTALWCDEFRLHKLAEYKKSLDQKQPGFLREKAEKYRWIMKEEAELGLEPSVSEKDIEDILAKADQLESKLESSKTEVRDYHVFDPSVRTQKGHFIG